MIIGIVNQHLEALINLIVHGPHGQEREIEAVIDTGFSSYLKSIPIHESNTNPLVGMDLLYGYNLSVQVVEGGSVIINALPHEKPMA